MNTTITTTEIGSITEVEILGQGGITVPETADEIYRRYLGVPAGQPLPKSLGSAGSTVRKGDSVSDDNHRNGLTPRPRGTARRLG